MTKMLKYDSTFNREIKIKATTSNVIVLILFL